MIVLAEGGWYVDPISEKAVEMRCLLYLFLHQDMYIPTVEVPDHPGVPVGLCVCVYV